MFDLINVIANIQQLSNDSQNASNNDIMRALELQNQKYLEEIIKLLNEMKGNSNEQNRDNK